MFTCNKDMQGLCRPHCVLYCKLLAYYCNTFVFAYVCHCAGSPFAFTIYFSSLHAGRELWIYVGYVFGLFFPFNFFFSMLSF